MYIYIYMRVSVQGSRSPQDEPVESFRSDGLCQYALNPLPRRHHNPLLKMVKPILFPLWDL